MSDLSFLSYAALGEASRFADLFHLLTLNSSTDLMPKARICCVAAGRFIDCRHVRGRRKDGGKGTATSTEDVFGGILACKRP